MFLIKGLNSFDSIIECIHYKESKETCRAGAPLEGVEKNGFCPFDVEDQYLCGNFEIDVG